LLYADPAYDEISKISAIISQSISNPVIPPGATIRYISVNHGKKRNPSNGQSIVVNVELKYAGLISHQNSIVILGPSSAKIANPQHILSPFYLDIILYFFSRKQ
jgi:hypothetical protein